MDYISYIKPLLSTPLSFSLSLNLSLFFYSSNVFLDME